MKEATGEGSMTIITIVVIVGLAAAAGLIIKLMMDKADTAAGNVSSDTVDVCPDGYNYSTATKKCVKTAG